MDIQKLNVSLQSNSNNRGVAQLASASGLGPEGPVFESQYPDTKEKQSSDFQVVAFLFSGFWGIMHQRPRFGMTLSTRLFRCLYNLHKERMSFAEKNPGPRGPGFSCGEIGIRTRDTILSYTRFPGVPLKPLEHLSNQFCISSMMIYVNEGANIGIIFRISFLLGKNLHFC